MNWLLLSIFVLFVAILEVVLMYSGSYLYSQARQKSNKEDK